MPGDESKTHWIHYGIGLDEVQLILSNPSFKYFMMFHSSTPKPRQTSVAHPKPLRNCRSLQQFLHIFMLILISFQLFAFCLPTSSSRLFLRAFCVFSSSSKCRYSDQLQLAPCCRNTYWVQSPTQFPGSQFQKGGPQSRGVKGYAE